MNPDKFTHKTNEALAGGHELASNAGHAQFTPLHIAVALIADPNGIFRQAISAAGGGDEAAKSVERVFNQALKKLPSQTPAQDNVPASTSLVYGARPIRRWLEKKVVTELSRMLIRGEIDENTTVWIDAAPNRKELSYHVEKNAGLVNPTTGKKSDILIQVPNGPVKSDASQAVKKMKIEEILDDDTMDGMPSSRVKTLFQELNHFVSPFSGNFRAKS
ncbi:Clp ATPase, C-terminal [Dillenia turbinata]|uniref:Clp ATPase, C-terminal n=1 Tax=Dillenia turbinata TaxID=194707 RepID=A0AAN8Z3I1_9MAGN